MKLIFLQKTKDPISLGETFPVIEIPIKGDGEKTSLNDFQWWAPTESWKKWLKENPREWQAESQEFGDFDSDDFTFESKNQNRDGVISFGEFQSLLEAEDSEISEEEALKRYTKFLFAYNKLKSENKIKGELDFSELQKNQKYAFILDLIDDDQNPVPESRNAYAFELITDGKDSNFFFAKLSETILTGEVSAEEPLGEAFRKVANYIGKAIGGGALVIGATALGFKIAKSLATRVGLTKLFGKVLPQMAKTDKGLGVFSRVIRNSKYYTTSAGGVIPFIKGARTALKSGQGVKAAITAGRTAVGGARAASGLARASNPIGWIVTAAMATQMAYNWLSSNQAPRFSEIKDEGIGAKGSFSPGTIPIGESITVCWTQDSQGFLSALGNILVSNDTRTTMEILKIGNFEGKALFYLVDVHSESMKKMLQENSMIILSFDEGAKFERGYFDNDDIDLEYIAIEDASSIAVSTSFQGYCNWEEILNSYEDADEKMLEISENAPDEYSFHFTEGETNRIINVTGKLVKSITTENIQSSILPKEGEGKSNESFILNSGSEILSFSEFSNFEGENYLSITEEEKEGPESGETQLLTETQKIAPYTVEKIEYADSNFNEDDLPFLNSFIVPNEFLEAKNYSSIEVEPVQEVKMKQTKRGLVFIESEEGEKPIVVPETPEGGDDETEIEGGVPVEYTKGEIKVKYRDNPDLLNSIGIPDITKIKDKDRKDKVKLLDMITPDEKEDLDMKDWNYIKKVKIYKKGETGDPYMIKFKSGGMEKDRSRKIKSDNPNFDVALRVADRILSGFKKESDTEEE